MGCTLENVSDPGRIRVTREGEAILLESDLCGANVAFAEHGELGGGPSMVGPTVATVNLLSKLGREIKLHLSFSSSFPTDSEEPNSNTEKGFYVSVSESES